MIVAATADIAANSARTLLVASMFTRLTSLLRGAAPIERAIMAGDEQTGVCIMQMDEGLDTGPVLAQTAVPIAPEDSGAVLRTVAGRSRCAIADQHIAQIAYCG